MQSTRSCVCGRCIKRDGWPHGNSWNWTNRFLENTRLAQSLKPWVKINMAAFIWFQCALHANQISKMCKSWQQEKVTSINAHLMPTTQMWPCSKLKIYTDISKYLFFRCWPPYFASLLMLEQYPRPPTSNTCCRYLRPRFPLHSGQWIVHPHTVWSQSSVQ